MSVVRGLEAILFEARPREEQHPTVKQLNFVREKIGEDELDRILMLNLNRGTVTNIISDWIDRQPKRSSRFRERPTAYDLYDVEDDDFYYTGDYLDFW